MGHKEENKKTYDHYAQQFESNTKGYLETHLLADVDVYLQHIPGIVILDLGSGPGRDALYFKNKGHHTVCIDISSSMVALCKEKGLEAFEMDCESLSFAPETFHGVWAYTSLLHVPKQNMVSVLAKIHQVLTEKGVLYIGMKEGNFEGFHHDARYPGCQRYSSFYSDNELRLVLQQHFDIVHSSVVTLEGKNYLNYVCRKK